MTGDTFDPEFYTDNQKLPEGTDPFAHWLGSQEGSVNQEQHDAEVAKGTQKLMTSAAEAVGVPLTAMSPSEVAKMYAAAEVFIRDDKSIRGGVLEALGDAEDLQIPGFDELIEKISPYVESKVGKPETWNKEAAYERGKGVTDLDIVGNRATLIAGEDGKLAWQGLYDMPGVPTWNKERSELVTNTACNRYSAWVWGRISVS